MTSSTSSATCALAAAPGTGRGPLVPVLRAITTAPTGRAATAPPRCLPTAPAAEQMADHGRMSWAPRMRRRLFSEIDAGTAVEPLVAAVAERRA